MKVVIQRVSEASVSIDGRIKSKIESGFLILLGVQIDDDDSDVEFLVKKISGLRVFNDSNGKMNLSILQVSGSILVISQFTLHASTKKGNRPSFILAARPEKAIPLYEKFIEGLRNYSIPVEAGLFGADMKVALINDGPVTVIIDSKNKI